MSTRRSLAGGAVLALLGAAGASAASPLDESTDAELIRLCGEFDVLERQYRAAVSGMKTFEDEDRAEE